jgi:hypothetical protein
VRLPLIASQAAPGEWCAGYTRAPSGEITSDCLPHQAAPGEWCGHVASGASSYFDRLWKTGLSVHSAKHERYVLHVCKPGAAP